MSRSPEFSAALFQVAFESRLESCKYLGWFLAIGISEKNCSFSSSQDSLGPPSPRGALGSAMWQGLLQRLLQQPDHSRWGGILWLLSQAKALPPHPWLSSLQVPLSSRSAGWGFMCVLSLGGKLACNWAPMPATREEVSHIHTWSLTSVVMELGPWKGLRCPVLQNCQ